MANCQKNKKEEDNYGIDKKEKQNKIEKDQVKKQLQTQSDQKKRKLVLEIRTSNLSEQHTTRYIMADQLTPRENNINHYMKQMNLQGDENLKSRRKEEGVKNRMKSKNLLKQQLRDPLLMYEIDQSLKQAQRLLTPSNIHRLGFDTYRNDLKYIEHTPRITAIRKTINFHRDNNLQNYDLNNFLFSSMEESMKSKSINQLKLESPSNAVQEIRKRKYKKTQQQQPEELKDFRDKFKSQTPKTPQRIYQKVRIIKLLAEAKHGACKNKSEERKFTQELYRQYVPSQQLENFKKEIESQNNYKFHIRPQSVKKRLQLQLDEIYDINQIKQFLLSRAQDIKSPLLLPFGRTFF